MPPGRDGALSTTRPIVGGVAGSGHRRTWVVLPLYTRWSRGKDPTMWRIVIITSIVVLALVVLLRRRGASGPSGDDALRDSGLTPESSRIRPDNHGIGGM